MVNVVGNLLVRVAQRGQNLLARHGAMHPRQRRQRLARPDLDPDAIGLFGKVRHAVGKHHRPAQVLGPVIGAGGLFRGQRLPGPVRDHRQPRRMQGDRRQERAKTAQNWLQHPGMGGNVDGDALGFDPFGRQPRRQIDQRGIGAGDNGQFRCVHAGDIQIAQMRAQGVQRQRHRQHPARRHRIEQCAAQMHQGDAILETQHPGQAGRRILAHRMADQRGGTDSPAFQHHRQRVFGDHDQRQLHRGLLERLVRPRFLPGFRQPECADVIAQPRLQHGQPAVHPFGKDRLGLIQIARHPGVLRTAAGEQEHHIGIVQRGMGEHAAGVVGFEQCRRLIVRPRDHHPPLAKGAATLVQGPGDIGQILPGIGAQMRGQIA